MTENKLKLQVSHQVVVSRTRHASSLLYKNIENTLDLFGTHNGKVLILDGSIFLLGAARQHRCTYIVEHFEISCFLLIHKSMIMV